MGDWWEDLRYSGRMIARQPGASALAVVALALGIGLTTTMFSIVQGAILRGLPFPESEKIQYLSLVRPSTPGEGQTPSYHDFVDWRTGQHSFESLEGFVRDGISVTGPGGYPIQLSGARLTPGVLRALRIAPLMGRGFTEEDAAAGAPGVILIGYEIWESRFQSRPDIIGETLYVNGVPSTVIGVMPPKFGFPQEQNAWQPLSFTLEPRRGGGGRVGVIGRLRDGVSIDAAAADMATIADQLAAAYPDSNKDTRILVGPYVEQFIGAEVVSTLFTMLGAVFGVMIIACVNVTNLQLARAAERTKEVAVRVALGAGRWRIIRQALIEGLLLSGAGAGIGLGLAWAGTWMFMRAIVDTNPPFWIDVRLDPVVLIFVTGITITAALVSSLVPGWRLARADVNDSLKDDSRGTTSLRMGRFTRGLVIVEVAVSCILLVVSGLMIRSIVATSQLSFPFATEDVFVGRYLLDQRLFPEQADLARTNAVIDERLSRIPGVRAVALGTDVPRATSGGTRVEVEGKEYESVEAYPNIRAISVSDRYFDVLGVQTVLGRSFGSGDVADGLPVAIVDEGFARRHLAEGAIGRRIRFGRRTEDGMNFDNAPWLTVVGVVPLLIEDATSTQVGDLVFRPMTQAPNRAPLVLASTPGDPMAIAGSVRQVLAGIGDGIPVTNVNTLAGQLWQQGWAIRIFGGLFTLFGLAALLLAATGLYGVMAFSIRQRAQEIGVRMAMGADRSRVLRMVMWQGVWRVAAAIIVGLVPGWWVGTQMSALVRGVTAADPLVHSVTAATLLLSGILATLAPALRAASIDPIHALRGE